MNMYMYVNYKNMYISQNYIIVYYQYILTVFAQFYFLYDQMPADNRTEKTKAV